MRGGVLRVCLYVLLLLSAPGGVWAGTDESSWALRSWQADEGLPDNRVTGLAQTPDGYLWVATRAGLVRFNGFGFESFDLSAVDGVIGNGARAMFSDSQGHLWLGGLRETVFCLGPTTAQVFNAEQGVPVGQLSGFAEGSDGVLWLAFGGRVFCVDGRKLKELKLPESISLGSRATLARDLRGRVWCAARGRLGLLSEGQFQAKFTTPGGEAVLSAARDGGLWLCAGASILKVDTAGALVTVAELPARAVPLCSLEDVSGAFWIGTQAQGLFVLKAGLVHKVESSHQQIGSLLEDSEGSLWAGTYGGGLNRLRPRALELLGPRAGLPSEAVISVCQDKQGRYWAVMSDGQLACGDGRNWNLAELGPLWSGVPATCVAADAKGRLWVGTRGHGITEIDLEGKHSRLWQTAAGLPSNSLRSLFVAADDSLWFATNSPTALFQLKDGVLRGVPLPPTVRNIRCIVQQRSGELWIGTSDGQVLRLVGERMEAHPAFPKGASPSVRSLHASLDGGLCIGYADKGLWHFKDGVYTRLNFASGQLDDAIEQMASDKINGLWLLGAKGLYRVSMTELCEVLARGEGLLHARHFGRQDGLPSLQPHYDNAPTVSEGREGRLLFSTSLGLLSLQPDKLREKPQAPVVVLERVLVDEQLVAQRDTLSPLRSRGGPVLQELGVSTASLQLDPGHHRLVIDFAALTYAAPETVRFRYRLLGADKAWIEAGLERSARFSRLPAGDYNFEVLACNENGVCCEVPASLALRVLPFYWQNWWFRGALLLAFTGLIVAIVRFSSFRILQGRLRRAEQQAALFQERTRIARDIHDDLGGSLAHIKLLSEIAAQEKNLPATRQTHLHQITSNTQQIMKSLDEIVWAINPRNDTLPHLISYIGQYAVEFLRAAGISCSVDLPEMPPELQVTSDLRHNLFLSVKEALTNVVRHSGAKAVKLRLILTGSQLSLEIEDDGRGFDTTPEDALADGLRNMRQRLGALGGQCLIESRVGAGTRIRFEITLGPSL